MRQNIQRVLKKIRTEKHIWLKISTVLLVALIIFEIIGFTYSYKNLNRSIQNERIDSVQQISELISGKLSMLRDHYVYELKQSAQVLTYSEVSTLEEANEVLMGAEDLYLLEENGACTSLKGDAIVLSTSELLRNIDSADDIDSQFCTVQTKGDYWIFYAPLRQVTIDGKRITGLLKLVDAQDYADSTAASVFEGQGASYVVDQNGVIVLRPSVSKANTYFQGYNLFQILQQAKVEDKKIEVLREAIKDHTKTDIIVSIQKNTWLIQSFPDLDDLAIVMTIPISITAQKTFEGMNNVVIMVTLIILTIAALFLIWIYQFVNKTQKMKLESAKASLKSDFMNKMSHDIRTPLNAIVGMHELALRSTDKPEVVADCLNKAKTSSEYLISVINDMLDMSRIESGKMRVSNIMFHMGELLDTVMQLESNPASLKNLNFQLERPVSIHQGFSGDPVHIKQCLINLISNAIKFTPENGTVTLGYEEVKEIDHSVLVRFTVQDTGAGMSEEFMQRMFQPFEQEQSSLSSPYVGSGLGLAIVHNLVSLMNGKLEVESRLNAGTKFVIEFTLEKTEDPEDIPEESFNEELPASIHGKRLLLAEDNDINREIITDLLTELGFEVDAVGNGAEAVERFVASPIGYYAMILMDIQMPVMNGLEASQTIRNSEHPEHESIPILALSANAFEEDIEDSVRHGMQEHLTKPIDIAVMKKNIMKYIR